MGSAGSAGPRDRGPRCRGPVRTRGRICWTGTSWHRRRTRVWVADPHSPWQRPTNENTNSLLRQYFPKGTDPSRWSPEDLEAVAHALNNRPRKILGWKTPAETFEEHLRSLQQSGVATTP